MFYGCHPPKIDLRDYKLNPEVASAAQLPDEFALEERMKIKNQMTVSSCVAHAMSSILEYHDNGRRELSTNFIYGIQREVCGREAPGMYLSDACKIVNQYGDMIEDDCSGNNEVPKSCDIAEKAFNDAEKLERAKHFKVTRYFNCNSNADIKYAIMNYGPVLCSIKWYDKYKVNDGIISFNQTSDYGYHAIVIYGWNKDGFLCQNSWGILWGNKGRFILPYDYKIREAKGLVDYVNEKDIVIPKTNDFLDVMYKVLNWIFNLVKKFTNK